MDIKLAPGSYIIAVSGGVDSVVLLDVISRERAKNPAVDFVVAHFDHGIRSDSQVDRQLVERLARKYTMPFVFERVELGDRASEATARRYRYAFLEKTRRSHAARAILTAHHKDDVTETALLNLLRGTKRRGLSSLSSRKTILRPFLAVSKQEIIAYAISHKLKWREDSTNLNERYKRNYIRRVLLPKLSKTQTEELERIIASEADLNYQIDHLLESLLDEQPKPNQIDRMYFNQLPHNLAKELLAFWLRRNGIIGFDAPTIERLVIGAKTAQPGKRLSVRENRVIEVGKEYLALTSLER